MHPKNLAGVDLNLLVALDALLSERSVTRAARRVGLSQPAMSHSLARLRALLDDPLLVRAGAMMEPTPRAEAMAAPLREALATLAETLGAGARFDPATARWSARVASVDYATFVLLPPLMERLGARAPGVDLWCVTPPDDPMAALHRGDVDLGLTVLRPGDSLDGIGQRMLFEERFVCLVRKGHRLTRGRLTLARFAAAEHALIAPRGGRGGVVDDLLTGLGVKRSVRLALPHFLVAPHVVARTDLVLTVAERVARTMAASLPLTVLEPPLALPGFAVSLVWSARRTADPALSWLRGELEHAAATVQRSARRRTRAGE